MSDQASYISQIQEEESKAAMTLENVGTDNDSRLSKAAEDAEKMIAKAEEDQREEAKKQIGNAREIAKGSYAKLLVESDNSRRAVIENGKTKISKGKSHIVEAFMTMFE